MRLAIRTCIVGCLVLSLFPLATPARALDCPGEDLIGFVFDNGDINLTAPAFTSVPAHVVILNPTFDAVYGYEFGFHIEGNHMVVSVELNGVGPIDVGGGTGNHIVGLASPMP